MKKQSGGTLSTGRTLLVVSMSILMLMMNSPITLGQVELIPTTSTEDEDLTHDPLRIEHIASVVYNTQVLADSDDDWWSWNVASWEHWLSNDHVYVHYETGVQYTGQFRFMLNIPKGATISSAYFSAYEDEDARVGQCMIQRIDETNVGPLEADDTIPNIAAKPVSYYSWNGLDDQIGSADITELIQAQVDLANWQSGYHIGIRFTFPSYSGTGMHRWNDYQSLDSSNPVAFLNISYTEPSPQPVSWLNEWSYRKSHDILQTPNTGMNYAVPIDVYLGSGIDMANTVFLDQNARPGLDDVRFTDENNEPIDYWLEDYYRDPIGKDYFVDDGAVFGWYYYCYPSVFYYNDRTYCTYQGDGFYAYITYYDHENKTWSPRYYVGESQLSNDDHGAPALWVDNEGYIHVVYGAHNDPFMHAKSAQPERIDRFEMLPSLGTGSSTYPNIAYDSENDIVHLWYRRFPGDGICNLEYMPSSDNGQTWSSPKVLVTVTPGCFVYKCVGGLDNLDHNKIHFTWALYNSSAPYGQVYTNAYYGYFSIDAGLVYNVTGHSQGSTVTVDEWPNMLALYTGGCHVTGPNMKVPRDSPTPYLVFNVVSRAGTGARTSTMVYWTGSEWSGMKNISTTTTNGASDIIIYSSSNISAFVTTGSDITHWTWDGSSWAFVEYCYRSQDSGGNYLTYATVPVGAKWTGSNNPEIQIVFTEHIPAGGKHTKGYAWGAEGIVQRHEITGARFWVKCPGNLSEQDQKIYVYYGRASAISSSKSFAVPTYPSPVHGVWGSVESLCVFDTSSHSITRFSETAPDNVLLYTDSETAGSGFAESFAVVNDWTSTGSLPVTNGDVCTVTVPGDASYDNLITNSASLPSGYYYIELRFRANVAGTSYFKLRSYEEDDAGGMLTLIIDSTYPSTSWGTYRAGFRASHNIESIGISCIATSTTTGFQFDYLRITSQTGWQHDGSTTFGITASGGGSISSDGDYISLTSDTDGSTFDIAVDTTSTATPMSADAYPFLCVRFHPEDANDIYTLQSYDGSSYGTLVNSKNAVDGRYYLRDLDTTIMHFRFIVRSSETIRIDFLKMYSISNFSITYSGGHTDAYLYVDSDGALVSSEDFVNWIELEYEPAMNLNTEEYQWAQIDQSNFSHFNLDLTYHLDSWSAWDEEMLYHLYAGTMSGFKFRLSNAGKINSIEFGSLPRGPGSAPTNVQTPTISNLDDSSHLYARTKDYQITTFVSDSDGCEDITYMELSLVSDDHIREYWTAHYDADRDLFSEQSDSGDLIALNTVDSSRFISGNTSSITFFLTINWNHPDLVNVNFKCVVVDDELYSDRDYYSTGWSVETRLDMPTGLALSDGFGTLNRGDINGEIQATGTVTFFGSTLHPPASEVDIFIVSPQVASSPWIAANYDESSGEFTLYVYADDSVGADTYSVRIINKGDAVAGTNLLGLAKSANYIADAIDAAITPIRAACTTATIVFALSLTYAYDGAPATDYSAEIHKNGEPWQVVTSDSFSDVRDTENDNTYSIVSVVENGHGLVTLRHASALVLSAEDALNIFEDGSSISPATAIAEIYYFASTLFDGLMNVVLFVAAVVDTAAHEFYSASLFLLEEAPHGFVLGFMIVLGGVVALGSLRRRRAKRKARNKTQAREGPSSYEPKTVLPTR